MGGLSEYGSLVGGGPGAHRLPSNLGAAVRWLVYVLLALVAIRLGLGILRGLFRR